jgi:hypothetical protein
MDEPNSEDYTEHVPQPEDESAPRSSHCYPGERVLEDDYPVHFGYWYVVDGSPLQCELFGGHATVFELRITLNAREIRNCDLRARGMLNRCV